MLRETFVKNGLSLREAEVAELVTRGHSNRIVADSLFVTDKTIKFHLTNIFKKLKIKSRAQLIVWAMPHIDFVEKSINEAEQMAKLQESQRQVNLPVSRIGNS